MARIRTQPSSSSNSKLQRDVPISNLERLENQAKDAKYLGLDYDHRLNCRKHMFTKRKQLGIQLSKMYWLLANRNCRPKISRCCTRQSLNLSGLMASNCGATSNSSIEILERFQNKYLRIIVNTP